MPVFTHPVIAVAVRRPAQPGLSGQLVEHPPLAWAASPLCSERLM